METELARLAGQPGKWDEFLLHFIYKKISACSSVFKLLSRLARLWARLWVFIWRNFHPGKQDLSSFKQDLSSFKRNLGNRDRPLVHINAQ